VCVGGVRDKESWIIQSWRLNAGRQVKMGRSTPDDGSCIPWNLSSHGMVWWATFRDHVRDRAIVNCQHSFSDRTGPAVRPVKDRTRTYTGPVHLKDRLCNWTGKNRLNRPVFAKPVNRPVPSEPLRFVYYTCAPAVCAVESRRRLDHWCMQLALMAPWHLADAGAVHARMHLLGSYRPAALLLLVY
jgi:hypothetical protein